MKNNIKDTICALASANGISAIALVRLSGKKALQIGNQIFSKNLIDMESHTIHFGYIKDKEELIDEVLISFFKGPNSFTGEDVIEISCHGSIYIQNRLLQLLISKGARMATEGEFTLRAFSNRKMDLSQAEAIADLIASEGKEAHKIAINQMRGEFSNELKRLRTKLVNFASLIELELDFSEEDVEFADRRKFQDLLIKIQEKLKLLIESFQLGNVIKNGIPVAIVGTSNVGKSTLLNTLVREEKAIVTDIAGTTRDIIEDEIHIDGIKFRFIDTAGLRNTSDKIEKIGIKKAIKKAKEAKIIIYLLDATSDIKEQEIEIKRIKKKLKKNLILVVNKIDLNPGIKKQFKEKNFLFISAKQKKGINKLTKKLKESININKLYTNNTIVSNSRHFDELNGTLKEIITISEGLKNGISEDLLAVNIRKALYHLGNITGEVTTDELLGNIFRRFCIGK